LHSVREDSPSHNIRKITTTAEKAPSVIIRKEQMAQVPQASLSVNRYRVDSVCATASPPTMSVVGYSTVSCWSVAAGGITKHVEGRAAAPHQENQKQGGRRDDYR
jgi:hypothetical protein